MRRWSPRQPHRRQGYVSEVIGDGSDAEGNEFRPAFKGSFAGCYDGDRVLCSVPESLPSDPRWALLDGIDLEARGVPTADLSSTDDVAQRVARRFLVRQLLKADDFPGLAMQIRDIPTARRKRIGTRLASQGVDTSDLSGLMTIREALKLLLPRFKMKPFGIPQPPAPRGSFTDAFTRADENLETSANWTRVDGAAGACAVRSNQLAFLSTTDSAYQCPDQSSANHYTQAVMLSTTVDLFFFECCARLTDKDNFIGARRTNANLADDYDLYKRDTGSFTSLGSWAGPYAANDVMKIEADGNTIEMFVNGTSRVGPVTESFNNTETRQGIVARSKTQNPAMDDFEAGVIASATNRLLLLNPPGLDGGLGGF
jgi:hypothetical protein